MSSESTAQGSPVVSVIVPAYNYAHFIGQTLESLAAQTYPHWECLVVDDGSTDNTGEVVRRYAEADGRIKYIHQKNQGLGASRNTGIEHATGDYFQFLDADDMLEPQKFEFQVNYMESRPEVDIVYGNVRFFSTENPHERLISMWQDNTPWMPEVSGNEEVLLALVRANIMVVNAPLLRRSAIESIGLFDNRLKGVEDWDYWIRCAIGGKRFSYQDREGTRALVRSHPASMSRDRWVMYENTKSIRSKLNRAQVADEIRRLNRQCMLEEASSAGITEIEKGDFGRGIPQLFVAGMACDRMTTRLRWMACACLAPFVPPEDFQKMLTLPLSRMGMFLLRRGKSPFSKRRAS